MSIRAKIADASGSRRGAVIDEDFNLHVLDAPAPPYGQETKMRAFRQFLTTDGTAGGTRSMLVNGSSTNVDFYVPASQTADRYITTLSFQIVDASATLNSFGNIAALTNGCRLFYSDKLGEVDIHDALKTNFNFIRLCVGNPAFGDAAAAFRANNVAGTSEGYIPALDLRTIFGFRWGLRLAAGSQQRVTLRIRDNVSAIDAFDCIAYGFERSE